MPNFLTLAANQQDLAPLVQPVDFRKVRAHAGLPLNEAADVLAKRAAHASVPRHHALLHDVQDATAHTTLCNQGV